jgi:hypothetical protein
MFAAPLLGTSLFIQLRLDFVEQFVLGYYRFGFGTLDVDALLHHIVSFPVAKVYFLDNNPGDQPENQFCFVRKPDATVRTLFFS